MLRENRNQAMKAQRAQRPENPLAPDDIESLRAAYTAVVIASGRSLFQPSATAAQPATAAYAVTEPMRAAYESAVAAFANSIFASQGLPRHGVPHFEQPLPRRAAETFQRPAQSRQTPPARPIRAIRPLFDVRPATLEPVPLQPAAQPARPAAVASLQPVLLQPAQAAPVEVEPRPPIVLEIPETAKAAKSLNEPWPTPESAPWQAALPETCDKVSAALPARETTMPLKEEKSKALPFSQAFAATSEQDDAPVQLAAARVRQSRPGKTLDSAGSTQTTSTLDYLFAAFQEAEAKPLSLSRLNAQADGRADSEQAGGKDDLKLDIHETGERAPLLVDDLSAEPGQPRRFPLLRWISGPRLVAAVISFTVLVSATLAGLGYWWYSAGDAGASGQEAFALLNVQDVKTLPGGLQRLHNLQRLSAGVKNPIVLPKEDGQWLAQATPAAAQSPYTVENIKADIASPAGRPDPFSPLLKTDGTPVKPGDVTDGIQYSGYVGDNKGKGKMAILKVFDAAQNSTQTLLLRAGESFMLQGEKVTVQGISKRNISVSSGNHKRDLSLAPFVTVAAPGSANPASGGPVSTSGFGASGPGSFAFPTNASAGGLSPTTFSPTPNPAPSTAPAMSAPSSSPGGTLAEPGMMNVSNTAPQ